MTNKSSINDPASQVAGFILAGGQSRRMGRDKAGLPWGSGTLLDHMLRLVLTVAGEVRVVGKSDLPDRLPNLGPLGGIATALEVSGLPFALVVAVDLPLLTPEFLGMFRDRLISTRHDLVACRVGSQYPVCLGLRPPALPAVLRCLEQSRSVHSLIETAQSEVIAEGELLSAGFDSSLFANINTPKDWQRLRLDETKTE